MLVIWLLQPILFKWRQDSPSTDFASKQSRHLNALYHFGPCHACKQKVWHIFPCKLDILHNVSTFPSQLQKKNKLKFCHTVQSPRGAFVGLSPSETKLQSPLPNWNMKYYKAVMFVQISQCQAPLHKCTVKLPRRLSGDGSVATRRFSLAISLATMVRFWHHQWVQIQVIFINSTHCCTITKPSYIAMLFHKPKQHSKQ